jgi:hypothetical protein
MTRNRDIYGDDTDYEAAYEAASSASETPELRTWIGRSGG